MGIFSKFEGKMEDTFEGAAAGMRNAPISPVQIMKKAEKQMRREKVVSAGRQFAPTLYTILVNPDDDQRLFGFYPTLAGETETRLASSAAAEGLSLDCQPLVRFIVDDALRHGKFDVIAEVVSAPIIEQLRAEEMQRYGMGGAAPAAAPAYPEPSAPAYPEPAPYGYGQGAAGGFAPQAPQVPAAQPYAAGGFAPAQPMQAAQPYEGAVADPFAPRTPEPGAFPVPSVASDPVAAAGAYPEFEVGQPAAAAKPPLPQIPENEIDYSANYGEYTFNSQNFVDESAAAPETPLAASAGAGMFADVEPLPGQAGAPAAAAVPPAAAEFAAEEAAPAWQPQAQPAPAATPAPAAVADAHFPQEAPAWQPPAVPEIQPAAPTPAWNAPQPQQPAAYPGMAAGAVAAAAAAAPAVAAAAGIPNPAPVPPAYQPHTVAFTAGAGQANAMPNQAAVRAHLVDVSANRSYDLACNRVLLGRETSNNIVVNDLNASRQHAQIAYEPQGVWVITDLGSTNGTLVNGVPVTRRGLADGDRITLGMTEFVFSLR